MCVCVCACVRVRVCVYTHTCAHQREQYVGSIITAQAAPTCTHMCSRLQVAPYCNNFALSISNDRFNRAKTVAHVYSHKQHNTTDLHCCVVVMKGSGSELMSQAQLHYGTGVYLLHRLQNNGGTSMYIVISNSLSVENTHNFTIHTYFSSMFTCKAHVYI